MTAHRSSDHVEIDPQEARAGHTGDHVRYILAGGVALVILGFVFLGGAWFS